MSAWLPATGFDESGAVLSADDIEEFYSESRVLGLGEVMNYVGVVAGNRLRRIGRGSLGG